MGAEPNPGATGEHSLARNLFGVKSVITSGSHLPLAGRRFIVPKTEFPGAW